MDQTFEPNYSLATAWPIEPYMIINVKYLFIK